MFIVPAIITIAAMLNTCGTSYDSNSATARNEPSSAYLLLLLQPAINTAISDTAPTARM